MAQQAHVIPQTQEAFEQPRPTVSEQRLLLPVADACFEMFSVRELKKLPSILPELRAAFPECCDDDIRKAVSMALGWKRLLRAAGRPLH